MSNSEAYITSVQYSTWKICSQIAESYGVKFSKQFVFTLGQLTFEQIGIFAEDLEHFSNHAKRTVINSEDVKLLVRRIPNLVEYIDNICQKNSKQKKNDDKRKRNNADEDAKDGENPSTSKDKRGRKKKKLEVSEMNDP